MRRWRATLHTHFSLIGCGLLRKLFVPLNRELVLRKKSTAARKVTLVPSRSVRRFGAWAEQLLAKSTGKEGHGLIPVDGEGLGKPEMYGNDRVFVSLSLKGESAPKTQKKLQALEAAGHPVVSIELKDRMELGTEFGRWEVVTLAR
jgi:transaldolase/glucose-6-phosphate isomerase